MSVRGSKRALVVGIGGLGCPAAIVLARAGVGEIAICDDDVVDGSNLHRQILFGAADVGQPKVDVAVRALAKVSPKTKVTAIASRLLPENAVERVRGFDVVVEGSDNFATKFLAADACAIARVPVVHGAAVRWHGTALAVGERARPCYRCLFEDLPGEGAALTCDGAGVMGPVVGIVGALQADLAIALLDGHDVAGTLVTFDGKTDVARRRTIPARSSCSLCGTAAQGRIDRIDSSRYAPPA